MYQAISGPSWLVFVFFFAGGGGGGVLHYNYVKTIRGHYY